MEDRYTRQVIMPYWGEEGQARLKQKRVLVVGAGGLGSPALLYLAAAGVGTIGIADGDRVSLSNLNRQILYTMEDLDRSKALTAVRRLRDLNPEVRVIPYEERVLRDNGAALVRQYDLVIEASDNLETKDLMNELCVHAGIPLVWAAVSRFDGQMGVYAPGHACRRCIFPQTPEPGTYPTPAELGILGAVAGVLGAWEAVEAIKVLLGLGTPMYNRLLLWDGLNVCADVIAVERNPHCPVCGTPA